MNEIMTTVFGNIAGEPRHTITPQGAPVTSFRMASTTSRFNQDLQGYVDGHTTWLTVSCWRGLAFNAAASLHKGQPVMVYGTLRVREWKDGDRTGREVELDALSVGHDLRRGRSEFARVTRPMASGALLAGGGPESGRAAGEDATDEPVGFGVGGAPCPAGQPDDADEARAAADLAADPGEQQGAA